MLYIKSSQSEIETLRIKLDDLMSVLAKRKINVTTNSMLYRKAVVNRGENQTQLQGTRMSLKNWKCLKDVAVKDGNKEVLDALKKVFEQAIAEPKDNISIPYLKLPAGKDLNNLIASIGLKNE